MCNKNRNNILHLRLEGEDVDPFTKRKEFQRDRDRIIHSRAFRRLMHKTQIFNANKGEHYRNRLTHTLEVMQIARSIGRELELDEDLIEAIALGHRKSTFRNAAYCELFLEPHIGRSWEQNLYKMEVLDQYENRNILPRTFNKYKWRFFEWVLIEVVAGFCYFKLQQTMTGEIFISKLDTAVFCIMITLVFVSIVKIIWISNIVARKTEEREKWNKVINVSMEDLEQMNNKKNVDAEKSSVHKVEGYNNIAYRKVNEYSDQKQLKKELIDSIPKEGNRLENLLNIQFDLKHNLESEIKGKEITLSIYYPAAVFFVSIILSFIGGLLIGEFSNSMPFMIGLLIVCAVALSYTLRLVHRTRKLHENRTNNIEFYKMLKEIVDDEIRKEETIVR